MTHAQNDGLWKMILIGKFRRAFHGTAVIGFNIYILGGKNRTAYLNSCCCFDSAKKTWPEVAPVYTRRSYLSVAVLDKLVYALGGSDGTEILNTAERYDYKSNQWYVIAPMIVRRYHASTAAPNGKLYVAGGCNDVTECDTAEVYDRTSTGGHSSRECSLDVAAYPASRTMVVCMALEDAMVSSVCVV
jgi:hypothetical protein